MTRPRSTLVSLTDTPWYHVVSRCVRRAFLCGEDKLTGKNFEHRRGWIEARILELAAVFAVDVAAYAVMSNHYHVVLRIDRDRALGWSVEEVLARWTKLFTGPLLVQRYLSDARAQMDQAEVAKVMEVAETYRARLHDLSWFMRVLNETIARQANEEDGVKGHFWEGRFKSQALLDEQALLAAMAYVDLNPIRAGMAATPEESEYTSIHARLRAAAEETPTRPAQDRLADRAPDKKAGASKTVLQAPPGSLRGEAELAALPEAPLAPFDATGRLEWAVPFAFDDYLELVDTVGRAVHPKKRGAIPRHTPKILDRLGIDAEAFIHFASRFLKEFGQAVGAPARLVELAAHRQAKYLRGIQAARRVFEKKVA